RADYRSYLDSSLVVIFHVIFLLFIKVVEAERKLLFSPSLDLFSLKASYIKRGIILVINIKDGG
ncbi:hypothetical protein LMB68_00650, partial [Limosilactobacillus reuteri]|uniref:hypothetical protein n=1 Tax=Limosilactobacillus reuteri TaxID=1598 RepID=UPI001E2DCBBB